MSTDDATPPKYNPVLVQHALLEEVVGLHPKHLSISQLTRRIVADPSDDREADVAIQAIHDLTQVGLFSCDDGTQIVKPTPAALRAVALITG